MSAVCSVVPQPAKRNTAVQTGSIVLVFICASRDNVMIPLCAHGFRGLALSTNVGVALLISFSCYRSAYEAALRVAVARYGKALTLQWRRSFFSGIAEAAKRNKINVTIHRADRPTQAPLVIQTGLETRRSSTLRR